MGSLTAYIRRSQLPGARQPWTVINTARAGCGEVCHKREGIPHYNTHSFQLTYAQERYAESRVAGQISYEAQQVVSQNLGHNRVAVTYSYMPR